MEPVSILITLVLIGLVLHLVTTYIPMHPGIKTVVIVMTLFFTLVWLFAVAGITNAR